MHVHTESQRIWLRQGSVRHLENLTIFKVSSEINSEPEIHHAHKQIYMYMYNVLYMYLNFDLER